MSDALLQVGAQCAFPSCNLNDFLPIKCKCKSTFCRDHIFPDNHSCSAVKEYDADSSAASQFGQLKRCAFGECTKPSLYAFTAEPDRETCDKCHSAFCVQCVDSYCPKNSCSQGAHPDTDIQTPMPAPQKYQRPQHPHPPPVIFSKRTLDQSSPLRQGQNPSSQRRSPRPTRSSLPNIARFSS